MAVYLQIVLGALVRHTGSGPACGKDILTCAGTWLPHWGAGQLHMLHRLTGVFVFIVVIYSAWRVLRHAEHTSGFVKALAISAPVLVFVQILLGMMTVATLIGLGSVTSHLAVAILLLTTMFLLHLSLKTTAYCPPTI